MLGCLHPTATTHYHCPIPQFPPSQGTFPSHNVEKFIRSLRCVLIREIMTGIVRAGLSLLEKCLAQGKLNFFLPWMLRSDFLR